ncbi:MAG: hypothetical protein JSW55_17495 [Chloroflexota bacterium]|nr:MAG: hypothetical protein JSW55_17495 [Chloroflexota bacterium]
MDQLIPLSLLVIFVSAYLVYHFRGRPRTSDIKSLAELKARLADKRITIVQFYAPL